MTNTPDELREMLHAMASTCPGCGLRDGDVVRTYKNVGGCHVHETYPLGEWIYDHWASCTQCGISFSHAETEVCVQYPKEKSGA